MISSKSSRIRILGSGAYGTVYEIPRGKSKVAFKVGKPDDIENELYFHTQIYSRLSKCCKKYFVKPMSYKPSSIEELFETIRQTNVKIKKGFTAGYAMEAINGIPLRSYLNALIQMKKKNTKEIYMITQQVRAAFVCMWKLGYIHGDAHMGNILVTRGSNGPSVKIIDFGFVTQVSPLRNINSDTHENYKLWFQTQWPKVLMAAGVKILNPNLVYMSPNRIPMYCKNDLSQIKKTFHHTASIKQSKAIQY